MNLSHNDLRKFLEEKAALYERTQFIETDPISVPHLFTKKEDIEISAFLAATIAWGQRPTILKNAKKLVELMDFAPYQFILDFKDTDLKFFKDFKHRTFNGTDCAFFLNALKNIYTKYNGLEGAFSKSFVDSKSGICNFRTQFLETPHEKRSEKHLANPEAGSSAKRLNMFLRWMVRNSPAKVDFGIWKAIPTSALLCPLDVHSGNVARKLGLLKRTQNDWSAVEELTSKLREFDSNDPVKYDFALFGLGVFERF